MWIQMNDTNCSFTTAKSTVGHQSSASTFGSGRDIAYLVFSILQFGITVFGLVWVNYIIRKKDEKDEKERSKRKKERLEKDRQDAKERWMKEQRDKIADIINNEYNKIVELGIDEKLRKCKEKFEAMVMFYGRETSGGNEYQMITGHDILRFMLRNRNHFKGEALEELQQDLHAVVKLFRSLYIKFPPKSDCPKDMEELGPVLITDLGKIARSFISASKARDIISKGLEYFNSREEVGLNRDDDDKIERVLPYLKKCLSLGRPSMENNYRLSVSLTRYHEEDLSFELSNPRQDEVMSDLRRVEELLSILKRTITDEDLTTFTGKISGIWGRNLQQRRDIPTLPTPDWSGEHLRANILHAVRVFMLEVQGGSDIIQEEESKELVREITNLRYVTPDVQRVTSERAIQSMKWLIRDLEGDKSHLCGHQSIADILVKANEDIENSIRQALNDQ